MRLILFQPNVGMICTLHVIQKLLQNEITNLSPKLFWASFPKSLQTFIRTLCVIYTGSAPPSTIKADMSPKIIMAIKKANEKKS